MGRRKGSGTRLAALLLAIGLLVVVIHDFDAPRHRDFGVRATVFAIDQYRAHVSPLMARSVRCRFKPTCSAYGRAAVLKYGVLRGVGKTAKRIASCGPWTKMGTVDLP